LANSIIDLNEQLERDDSVENVFLTAANYFKERGFSALNIGVTSGPDDDLIGGYSNMCPAFIQQYRDAAYFLDDPYLDYCMNNHVERVCDPNADMQHVSDPTGGIRTLLGEARSAGQISSLLIPRHSMASDQKLTFNLICEDQSADLEKKVSEQRGEIMVATALIQTRIIETMSDGFNGKFWYPTAMQDPKLTQRELEILKWLADGARVDRIADTLGIANATVSFHIQGLKKKLDARTREHAVAMAIRKRLV